MTKPEGMQLKVQRIRPDGSATRFGTIKPLPKDISSDIGKKTKPKGG